MSLMSNFPVAVTIQQSSVSKPMNGLMYAIDYLGEGRPVATVYCLDTKIWLTIDLVFVTPILPESNDNKKEKRLLNE